MNVYAHEVRPRQSGDTTIVVVPSALSYAERLAQCHQAAYGYTPVEATPEDLTPDKFARHQQIFPEGQFMALEVETDAVLGLAVSMRLDFDPARHEARPWTSITGYG